MQHNLFECFKELPDYRRGQGMRYQLPILLSMVTMAVLSGAQGPRGFERFAKANKDELIQVFGLEKYGIPGYNSFHSFTLNFDFSALIKIFIRCTSQISLVNESIWVSLDGKGLKSTVKNGGNSLQDFVMVVSAFVHESNIVIGQKEHMNNKSGEAETVRKLISELGLKDVTFCLDALHTQKNA